MGIDFTPWFKSYLGDRQQIVIANETRSDPWGGISLQPHQKDGWKVISHHPLPSEIQTFDENPLGDTFHMNHSENVFIFRQPDTMNCAFYSFISLMVTLYGMDGNF